MRKIIIIVAALLFIFALSGCKGDEDARTVSEMTDNTVSASPAEKGEKIPEAGEENREAVSEFHEPAAASVDARNTPPRITSLNVVPEYPVAGDTITLDIKVSDKEEDFVDIIYAWSRNGVLLPGTEGTLEVSEAFERGDKIMVRVVPSDGELKGTPYSMVVYIDNASPAVDQSSETFSVEGDVYTHQIVASDPDGDTLNYSLEGVPGGMTIDQTGLITWNVPSDFSGEQKVSVIIEDGHRGKVTYDLFIPIDR